MTLAPASALLGALMLWAFRRTADRGALRAAINRIQAHLLEFWLFVDEPSLIWKSWKGLLVANARLLRALAVPLLVISIPMTPLFFCLDAFYGATPLPVGRPAVVTVAFNQPPDLPLALNAPGGIAVESPPVRVASERQVSWRVRPGRPLSGEFQLVLGGTKIEKSVEAGQGLRYLSRKRTRSLLELVRYPTEMPLGAGPIDWIEVPYPSATVPLLGLEAHWSVWFVAFSLIGALAVARRSG